MIEPVITVSRQEATQQSFLVDTYSVLNIAEE